MNTESLPTMLIVDDDEQINYVFCKQLKYAGFDCIGAGSVEEALNYLGKNGPPDVLVLDLQLGDGHGTQVLDYMRSFDYTQTRVIVVSASAFSKHYAPVDYSVDHVLVKPVSPRGLSVFLRELMPS